MVSKIKVVIDPSSRILYSSYYIEGLYQVFGRKNVSFSSKYFRTLKRREELNSYDHYMAFVVIYPDDKIHKFVIDFRDKTSIKESAYEWSDKYAKINFNADLTDKKFHDKILSIPPGFGIRIWNLLTTAYYCISNFIRLKFSPITTLKIYLADYLMQYKRLALSNYISKSTKPDDRHHPPYLFMIGTLWPHENCIKGTNLLRKQFIEACQSTNCEFEGGFFVKNEHPQQEAFKDIIFSQRYSIESYVKKTKQSAIVFNTPAVHNCHGWKLGEYLAMRKAIITTPISNQLPETLAHGKHAHIVSNSNDISAAIKLLLEDKQYRNTLEQGASNYFEQYATPQAVIQHLTKIN